jgi:hypothetical protein
MNEKITNNKDNKVIDSGEVESTSPTLAALLTLL